MQDLYFFSLVQLAFMQQSINLFMPLITYYARRLGAARNESLKMSQALVLIRKVRR
jgi:hypothetical protein